MKSAALFVFFCFWAKGQPAAVEGMAVHAATGEPMSGVHVRLYTGNVDAAGQAYGALSDSTGHFSISRIPSGSYIVTAERTGFAYVRKTPVAGPAATLTLKAGEHLRDLKLHLAPRAVIAGRVVDQYGDPVPGVTVMAEADSATAQPSYGMGQGTSVSDDRGEFRLRVAPGKYRVLATPRQMNIMSPDGRTGSSSDAVYGATYFPSTASRDQASVVDAGAGGEIDGIEIRLAQRSGFTISGTVSGIPESGSMASVMLQTGDNPHRISSSRGMGLQQDGKFRFVNLELGFYRIFAFYPSARPPLQSEALEFKLEADIANLQLALLPGGEITGTLEFAGGGVPAEKRTIRLQKDVQFGRQPAGEIDKENFFRIADVLPERYRVKIEPLPEDAYVKTVQLDGGVVADGVLDFSRGARDAKLKVTIGSDGGRVSGGVVEQDGQRVNSPAAMVYLLQDPENARQEQTVRVTAEGKYSFKAIRPGKYRLFAIDPVRSARGPNALREAFNKAEEIEIRDGDRIARDVKVTLVEEDHVTH
jgi:hypothetical protein